MKNVAIFLLFITYATSVFLINRFNFLVLFVLINISMIVKYKYKIKKIFRNLRTMLKYIVFVMLINYLLIDVKEAVLVGIKLVLVCNMTYIFGKLVSPTQLANIIEKLARPVKILKADPKDIGLLVCIAIYFIPILRSNAREFVTSLKSGGGKVNVKNLKIIMKQFFILVLKRADEIEVSLKAKAYLNG